MKELTHISITFNKGMEIEEKVVEVLEVGLEDDKFLVLKDEDFTKLQKTKEKRCNEYPPLNHCSIYSYWDDRTWGRIMHFMSITLYTTKSLKVAENLINKELNKHVQSKGGGCTYGGEIKVSL